MSALLLVSVLSFAFNIQPVEAASSTIYIRADGLVEPTTPMIQRNGDVYTLAGNIKVALDNDGIVVEKDNVMLDGAGYTIKGEKLLSYPRGICLSGRSNVTVENVSVYSFSHGVFLNNSLRNKVVGNNLTSNSEGIHLYRSSNNDVFSNNIESNGKSVTLYYSSSNTIAANDIIDNSDGVLLVDSANCSIIGNNFAACNHDGICLVTSSNNGITKNNIAVNVANGIRLDSSSNNIISENNIAANKESGIVFWDNSNYNIIVGNNLTGNKQCGIELSGTVGLYGSSNCYISENKIIENNADGIGLVGSLNNTITGNFIGKNSVGIRLTDSSNNSVYHNNFVNNTSQVWTWKSTNFWDNGVEGNCWSTYTGEDADKDGVGDSPCRIDQNNTDHHPLMNLYVPGDVNHDGKVNIIDISITAKAFGTQPGDKLWNPHADIDENGKIDIVDVVTIARELGRELEQL
jgi:parallel beta-helix repeat protein